MKELLEFVLRNILGEKSSYEIVEEDDGSIVKLTVKTADDEGGMVIGKGGKVIKAIRNILRIKATLEKKKIILLVNPS
ncbi:MAG: KH domain-containing protein [Patescibacteria group bacterium]